MPEKVHHSKLTGKLINCLKRCEKFVEELKKYFKENGVEEY